MSLNVSSVSTASTVTASVAALKTASSTDAEKSGYCIVQLEFPLVILWIFSAVCAYVAVASSVYTAYRFIQFRSTIDEIEKSIIEILDEALQTVLPMGIVQQMCRSGMPTCQIDQKNTNLHNRKKENRYAEDVSVPVSDVEQFYDNFGTSSRRLSGKKPTSMASVRSDSEKDSLKTAVELKEKAKMTTLVLPTPPLAPTPQASPSLSRGPQKRSLTASKERQDTDAKKRKSSIVVEKKPLVSKELIAPSKEDNSLPKKKSKMATPTKDSQMRLASRDKVHEDRSKVASPAGNLANRKTSPESILAVSKENIVTLPSNENEIISKGRKEKMSEERKKKKTSELEYRDKPKSESKGIKEGEKSRESKLKTKQSKAELRKNKSEDDEDKNIDKTQEKTQ